MHLTRLIQTYAENVTFLRYNYIRVSLISRFSYATEKSLEQGNKKPRLAAPSSGGGGIGPATPSSGGIFGGAAVSGESETITSPPVSKQAEQMLRVSLTFSECI